MDTSRAPRARTARKTARPGDPSAPGQGGTDENRSAETEQQAAGDKRRASSGTGAQADAPRVFDDLDLAGYIEEFLSVKVDAIGTNLERSVSDRLLDLVESNQKLLEGFSALREAMGSTARSEVAANAESATDDLRTRLTAAEERVAAMQTEIYALRDERATLKSSVESLEDTARRATERESAVQAQHRQGEIDLVGARAELGAITRQLQEARQKEEAVRIEASRLREELASLRAESDARRETEKSQQSGASALREALEQASAVEQGLRADLARLQDEVAALQAQAGEHSNRPDESPSHLATIDALKKQVAELQRLTEGAGPIDAARLATELDTLRQQARAAERSRDEARNEVGSLRERERTLTEQLAARDASHATLENRISQLEAGDKGTQADRPDLDQRVRAAEAAQREAQERLEVVEKELRAEIDQLTAKKNALTETLRAYSDPEKFRDAKLREMHQSIEAMRATMREKDNLLSESGKDTVVLGQELEKLRKEKYETQVLYERRIRELQESLQREIREKERERDERHLLEEQLAKSRKKWPLW